MENANKKKRGRTWAENGWTLALNWANPGSYIERAAPDSLESPKLLRNEAWSEKFLQRFSDTLCSVLLFSTWSSLETPKNSGFCQNGGQDGLLAVSSITNSYSVNPGIFIQYSFYAIYYSLWGNRERSPGVTTGEKLGEALPAGL